MSLNLKKISTQDQEELAKWDSFVDESPEGTFYHKSYWLINNKGKNFKAAQNYELYYIVDKNNAWQAAFYISFSKKFGKEFIVMPHMTPYGGVMFSEKIHKLTPCKRIANIKSLNDMFISKLKERTLLYYSFSPDHIDIQPFIWNKFNPSVRYTYRLNLQDEAILWSNLQEKTSVNKGNKSNVTVKWGFSEYLDSYFSLMIKALVAKILAILIMILQKIY